MANDSNRERKIGGMTTRQKATIGAFVVILLIIAWQVMGLFGGSKPTPAPAKPAMTAATAPGAQMGANAPKTPATPGVPGQPPAPRPVQAPQTVPEVAGPLRQTPVTIESKILEAQKSSEEKYIDQLNQLQLLRVQREIAETNQAIASARLATVTAERSVSDLLTKPAQPIVINPEAGAGALPPGGFVAPGEAQLPQPPAAPQPPPPPPTPTEIPYTVLSVSMQLGRWNAVMGYEGKLYNVTVGDILPDDKSIVTSINKNGVVLSNPKGKRRRISLLTSI